MFVKVRQLSSNICMKIVIFVIISITLNSITSFVNTRRSDLNNVIITPVLGAKILCWIHNFINSLL